MNSKKLVKKIMLGIIIGLLVGSIGSIGSISYAFFTYQKTGTKNSTLILGKVYLNLSEREGIQIENFEPQDIRPDEYYEFSVSGINEADKDVVYDINVLHGNDSTTEGAIRVQDKFVSFTLMKEVGNDNWETIIDSESYDDFEEPLRIYVDKINANTTSSVTHKYRLYVWLNRDMTIYGGDLTSEAGDYSIAEYKKLYTSVKIQVTGDYKAKNYEIPVHTVTFDYNDGVTESTTKRVVYHGHYGTLPTPPEREGYTFMGWNGKNLFNEDNITEQRFTEFNEQKILLDASSVLDNRMDRLELQLYKNGVRVTIYTGFYFTTVNKSTQITKNDTFDAILFKANTNKRDPYFIFSLNNLVDDKKYNLSFNILAYDTSISKVTISNFQLEEGDTVTEYEPCFITSGTKVVQDKNHTLTAIWKENN